MFDLILPVALTICVLSFAISSVPFATLLDVPFGYPLAHEQKRCGVAAACALNSAAITRIPQEINRA